MGGVSPLSGLEPVLFRQRVHRLTVYTLFEDTSSSSREHEFLVDTGSTHIGLPSDEIRSLGLPAVPNGRIRVLTATGVVEQETFSAIGQVLQRGFVATVTLASIPLIGYELLENLRLKVNPVKRELENVPDEQLAPPYQLVRL